MDWIDPKNQTGSFDPPESKARGRRKVTLNSLITAALAQSIDVWSEAFDQALRRVKWPSGCSAEASFLFSAVNRHQAEVLLRAGVPGKKLAASVGGDPSEAMASIVGLVDQPLAKLAYQWLDEAGGYCHSALAVAALTWNLPSHASRAGNDWLEHWFEALADRITNYEPDAEEGVLSHLVMQCEMPLLLGVATSASKRVVFAEASRAMDHIAEYLEVGAEVAAPWLVHGGSYLRASLASILRSRVLADTLGLRSLYRPQQRALAQVLTYAARWSRPDGTSVLGDLGKTPKASSIWNALSKLAKPSRPTLAVMALSGIGTESRSEAVAKSKTKKLPALSQYSEDASTACMQCDWRHRSGRVAADFSEIDMTLEIVAPKARPIFHGEWPIEVRLGDRLQEQTAPWGEICWFSDEDGDYLELEASFSGGARVQRQIALFREDKLALLSDTLLCNRRGDWSITSRLPLAEGVSFAAEERTTEALLVPKPKDPAKLPKKEKNKNKGAGKSTPKNASLVLPLFLPEWRRQQGSDSFAVSEDGELIASAHSQGRSRLYMPMLLSLCPSHSKAPYTWRHLTVAEELRIVEPDEAKAFRVQIGSDQWLLYRTLAPPKRRTALGMHTMSDFFAGRFDPEDGETDTIVEVDPA